MTVPAVVSQAAEDSCRLLFKTLGSHRVVIAGLPVMLPKTRLAKNFDEREQIQCQATLVRLLSITEAFCAERMLDQVEQLVVPSRSKATGVIWEEITVSSTRTWNDQRTAYEKLLGVQVNWKPIEHLAEARNAIAHGLGTLTRRQRQKEASVRSKIIQAGFSFDGATIVISDAALMRATTACRDFIEIIDLAVQNRPHAYR